MVIADDRIEPIISRELLLRARAGDTQAFCQLIEPLQTRLLRQAAALSRDLSVADDLVSETLVEAWRSLHRYNESCRLSTWLYAILLHRYQKSVRRAASRPVAGGGDIESHQENLPSTELTPSENAARDEFSARMRGCIERLPEKHREVILLRFFEDASLADMANALGCSVGTVKSRLHHALEKLRKMKLNVPDTKGDTQI